MGELRTALVSPLGMLPSQCISYERGLPKPGCGGPYPPDIANPGVGMHYTVELVHNSGAIDTLERLDFVPAPPTGPASDIPLSIVRTPANLAGLDTVFLRVRGSVSGLSDADTSMEFANEIHYGVYPSTVDSVLSMKPVSLPYAPKPFELSVLNPYPNPLTASDRYAYLNLAAPVGLEVRVDVLNELGEKAASLPAFMGSGRWYTVAVPVPVGQGRYFVRVAAGSSIRVVPLVVSR